MCAAAGFDSDVCFNGKVEAQDEAVGKVHKYEPWRSRKCFIPFTQSNVFVPFGRQTGAKFIRKFAIHSRSAILKKAISRCTAGPRVEFHSEVNSVVVFVARF